jgi:dihydrofolate reductase
MKTIIVAYDKKFGIGANNDLLWKNELPSDMKHFKSVTTGNAIVMGRNTYVSIGIPLPNRRNIVISHLPEFIRGVEVVGSLQAAYDLVPPDMDLFVIGGGQVYNLAFDSVDRILATEVNAVFKNASIFFPAIDENVWQETSREHHKADGKDLYGFDFVEYRRK